MKLSLEQNIKNIWDNLYSERLEDLPWRFNPIPKDILNDLISNLNGRKVLDYGCGDGVFVDILMNKNITLTCADISNVALELCRNKYDDQYPEIEYYEKEFPINFDEKKYNGIICWGVFHHLDKSLWSLYLNGFNELLEQNGVLLIGGHSKRDIEFKTSKKKSLYTKLNRFPFDKNFTEIIDNNKFVILKKGKFEFEEALTRKHKNFDYYILKKNN